MLISPKMGWDKTKAHHYRDKTYLKNRLIVLDRDFGCCVRCWTIDEHLVSTNIVDHFKNIASGKADHSLKNLWGLCHKCHVLKTMRESNGIQDLRKPFGDADRDSEGWLLNINWQAVIIQRNRDYLGLL